MLFKGNKGARTEHLKVHAITNVQESLSIDQSSRQRRYLLSMTIRTLCFILTVVSPSPYRWIALFGALILPYIAVIVANAGREHPAARKLEVNQRGIGGSGRSK